MTTIFSQDIQKGFLHCLLSGDHARCSEYAADYLTVNPSILCLYEEVFKSALYEVGELWELNKISVATEHLASAIVEAVLNELYQKVIGQEKINKTAIVACVENEYHQIGIKMISDVLEMNGWNTHFLGANTPTQDLIAFSKAVKPDMLAISLSIYFHLPTLEIMLGKIREEFPDIPVLVGGQAFCHGGREVLEKYSNVYYQPDLSGTASFIKTMSHG